MRSSYVVIWNTLLELLMLEEYKKIISYVGLGILMLDLEEYKKILLYILTLVSELSWNTLEAGNLIILAELEEYKGILLYVGTLTIH